MKRTVKFDIGKMLLIGAAAFQSYQFGRALNVYDPAGWSIVGVNLNGLILGTIINVIVAMSSTRLPSVTGKVRIRAAWAAFVVLMILSPGLVAPAMYLLFEPLPFVPMFKGALAVGLSSSPDLAITLSGFIAGKSLISLQSEAEKPLSIAERPTKAKPAKPSKKDSGLPCRYAGAGCGRVFATQNSANAHARTCGFKPTIAMPVDVGVRK